VNFDLSIWVTLKQSESLLDEVWLNISIIEHRLEHMDVGSKRRQRRGLATQGNFNVWRVV